MKWTMAFLAAIVFAMPLGFAQTSAEADAKTVSSLDLRFKQIGQAFGDFVFKVRTVLTFDEDAKVELLKERNAEMKERQQAWLELKASAFAEANLTAEEKKEIRAMIQAEHEAIVKEHLRLTSAIKDIQLKARAHGNAQLEDRAEVAAESGSGLSLGLVTAGHVELDNEIEGSIDTAAEAQAIVEEDFGFTQSSVATETRNGATVYVVSGTETEIAGNYKLTKSFQVEIQSGTGALISADMNAHIVAITTAATQTNAQASGSTSAGVSGSSSASTSGSASGSASAGATAGASASATAAGGITIG